MLIGKENGMRSVLTYGLCLAIIVVCGVVFFFQWPDGTDDPTRAFIIVVLGVLGNLVFYIGIERRKRKKD